MTRRLLSAIMAVLLITAVSATAALAGEITGNGKLISAGADKWGIGLHGRSDCAYSGQEDLQWFVDEGTDEIPVDTFVRGVPGHAQSWGQIPKADRDFLTSIGSAPGLACNPMK
jgi:hypothetical protein